MRRLLAIFALLPLIATGQDMTQRVAYQAVGVPAKQVLEDLSAKTGVQLAGSPQTNFEVLVISVNDVTLDELLRRIADVTSGRWSQEGKVLRLVADAVKRQTEAADELRARQQKVQKELDRLAGKGKPEATGGPAQFMVGPGGPGSPGSAALTKLLPAIGAARIAAIPDNGRIVFSTNPTRMQLPMPPNTAAIVQQMVQEHNKLVAGHKDMDEGKVKSDEEIQADKFMAMMGLKQRQTPINTPPSKTLLAVERNGLFGGIQAEIRLYDSAGKVLLSGSQSLSVDASPFAAAAEIMTGGAPKQAGTPGPDKEIVFSERTGRFLKYLQSMGATMMGGEAPPLPDDIKELLSRPDKYDPLSFVQAEAAVAVAKSKGLNLVGNLPDSMLDVFGSMLTGKVMLNAYFTRLQSGESTKAEITDNWLIVRPATPSESRALRTDRLALATLLQAVIAKGTPSLDDLAAYALRAESPMRTPPAMMALGLISPSSIGQGMSGPVNWDLLRLYGTMNVLQKEAMRGGMRIQFGSLAPNQRDIVTRLLFGASARLQIESRDAKVDDGLLGFMRQLMPGQTNDYREEPTEIMPGGLPADGVLNVTVQGGNFVMIAADKGAAPQSRFGALGPDELAMFKYFKEDPAMQQMSGLFPAMDRFQLGARETFTFRFIVAPEVSSMMTLVNDNMPKDSKVYAFEQLPAAFRRRVDERVIAFKKSGIPFMGLGRPTPPP